MPTRSARTTWTGGLQDGTGTVELVSSGIASYEVSFPRRAAEEAGGVTSPEELIAAAHSACFAMQFSGVLGQAGGPRRASATGGHRYSLSSAGDGSAVGRRAGPPHHSLPPRGRAQARRPRVIGRSSHSARSRRSPRRAGPP